MRVLLQRVRRGSVTVNSEVVGSVGRGYVALVGVTHGDTPDDAALLAAKTVHLRIFEDDQGKMNLSLLDLAVRGDSVGVLVVSQFTLYADARKGRRPSFTDAARPDLAAPLVEHYAARLAAEGVPHVAQGVFGAMMAVEIHNDGPVTIWLDTQEFK